VKGPWAFEDRARDGGHPEDGPAAGEADLAAVGMAAEHGEEAEVLGGVAELGAVAQKEARQAWRALGGGGREVVGADDVGVIDAGEGDGGGGVEDDRLVVEEAQAERLEGGGEVQTVVIAEHAEDPYGGLFEVLEEELEGLKGGGVGRFAAFEEIPRDDGDIKFEGLNGPYQNGEEGGIKVEVKIGEVKDRKTVQWRGPCGGPVLVVAGLEGEEVAVARLVEAGGAKGQAEEAVAQARPRQARVVLFGAQPRFDPWAVPARWETIHMHKNGGGGARLRQGLDKGIRWP
jgi:hypothetical protein